MSGNGPRPPSGPETGGPPSGPKGFAHTLLGAFEGSIVIAFALVVVFTAVAINPHLLAPSVMVVGAGLGIYALSLWARRRRTS